MSVPYARPTPADVAYARGQFGVCAKVDPDAGWLCSLKPGHRGICKAYVGHDRRNGRCEAFGWKKPAPDGERKGGGDG